MKAYKNANGLRYHKTHGHRDQSLKDNSDGTYSIVDLAGNPYPGLEGMIKAKPYACNTCGRRYKNANGGSCNLFNSNCYVLRGDYAFGFEVMMSLIMTLTKLTVESKELMTAYLWR